MTNIQLTQELVKSLFDYKDGFLIRKIKTSNSVKIGDIAGCYNRHKDGERRVICVNNVPYLASRLIFLWHHGYIPEFVDHRDRNTKNDKINNLREISKKQNCRNVTSHKNSSSKYLGVFFRKDINKWCAQICVDGKRKHLGVFKLEIDAANTYNEAAKINFGEYANLNII